MEVQGPNTSDQTVTVNMELPRGTHNPHLEYPQDNRQNDKRDFVYVNNAYVGSVNSVNSSRLYDPPTTVVLEQYWACSKWTFAQRVLALSVGVLLGTVISLLALILLKEDDDKDITNIFRHPSTPD